MKIVVSEAIVRTPLKWALLTSTCALAAAAPTYAVAQDEARSNGETVEVIVVTATRRSERVTDVPISIQAVGESELKKLGAVNFADYARTVAGISFLDFGPGRSQIFVRGVSTGGDIATGKEATVGVYLDEVPISEGSSQPDLKLFDINRVEVLRGPQGTLYGSGSLGGTVRVIPNRPEFDDFAGYLQLDGSTTRKGGENGAVNGWINAPLSDKVAVRLVGYGLHNAGFLDDGFAAPGQTADADINDEDTYGGRAAVRVAPTEELDIVLTGIYQKSDIGAFQQVTDAFPDLVIFQSAEEPFEDRYGVANLKFTYDFGFATLTSSTSYFDRRRFHENDIDFFLEAFGIPMGSSKLTFNAETITQELRLASSGDGALEWLAGFFFLDKDEDFLQTINVDGVEPSDVPAANIFFLNRLAETQQFAGFVELSYAFTEELTATAGVRVSKADRENLNIQDGIVSGGRTERGGAFDESSTTPKFNLSYKPSENTLFYVQAAKGFRIGGANPGLPPCDPGLGCAIDVGLEFGSDSLWNYEAGTKLQLFENVLLVNASVFYIDWSNIQLNVSRGDGFDGFLNAGDAETWGFELETSARVNDFLRVGGQITYTGSQLGDLPPELLAVGTPGQRLPDVPKWSTAVNAEVTVPVGNALDLYLRGDIQYVGGRLSALGPTSQMLDDYTLVNLRGGIVSGPYELSVFVTNLGDTRAQLSRTTVVGLRGGAPLMLDRITINRPRTIGISASRQF